MPSRRPFGMAGAVVVALAATVAIAGPAAAVEADGIRLDPADAASLGAGSALRPALLPGMSATFDLVVSNRRAETVDVVVYAADAPGGEVATGTDNSGAGTWIAVDEQQLTLLPDEAATVRVAVTRPDDDEDGGTAAVVVQLGEDSREQLDLPSVERAALLVEVAADATGSGVLPVITGTRQTPGLLVGGLTVDVLVTDPGEGPTAFDGSLELDALLAEASVALPIDRVATDALTTATVTVDLPWYGAIGSLRAVAGVVGTQTSTAPVRVVVVPPWLIAVVLLVTLRAVVRERHRRRDGPAQ